MAKVVGPLLSLSASGTIAKALNYSCGSYVSIPKQLPQDRYRDKGPAGEWMEKAFLESVQYWVLTPEESKKVFAEYAMALRNTGECSEHRYFMTGYNLFLHFMLVALGSWIGLPLTGALVLAAYIATLLHISAPL